MIVTALLLLAAAALLIGGLLLRGAWRQMHSEKVLNRYIDTQTDPASGNRAEAAQPDPRDWRGWLDRLAAYAARWIDTPLGKQLVAEEDRLLLAQCGINNVRGKALFFAARAVLGFGLPVGAWIMFPYADPLAFLTKGFFGFGIGYMGPKWVMQIRAKKRRRQAADELPLLIDLLRLLQGVGLSIDQSLNIVENEFSAALPVLSKELRIAAQQYLNGRTREQSLRRFSSIFDNDDMGAIARLIVQVDRYGGAVQQPLQQFSDRIRDQRKLDLKETVGKLTVKMTGVMVLTLLPALLIITGGAGFLAIIRTLSKIGTQ
jgi:tight adherence protein C